MAVRLDPFQTIVGVAWGVGFPLELQFIAARITSSGGGDTTITSGYFRVQAVGEPTSLGTVEGPYSLVSFNEESGLSLWQMGQMLTTNPAGASAATIEAFETSVGTDQAQLAYRPPSPPATPAPGPFTIVTTTISGGFGAFNWAAENVFLNPPPYDPTNGPQWQYDSPGDLPAFVGGGVYTCTTSVINEDPPTEESTD